LKSCFDLYLLFPDLPNIFLNSPKLPKSYWEFICMLRQIRFCFLWKQIKQQINSNKVVRNKFPYCFSFIYCLYIWNVINSLRRINENSCYLPLCYGLFWYMMYFTINIGIKIPFLHNDWIGCLTERIYAVSSQFV